MLDRTRFPVVLAALGLAYAPHILRLPIWVTGFIALAWSYAWGMHLRGWPVPPRLIRALVALLCMAAVLATHGRTFGQDAGVALLSLMMAMKPLESKAQRDEIVLLFLGYFVVITNVLYDEDLLSSAYMMLSVGGITGVLVFMYGGGLSIRASVTRGAMLLGQALPLAFLLFLFFPRLQGALWGVQEPKEQAQSGFSDKLEPDTISTLSLSQEVAFRVDFQSVLPARDQLYWRGLVLDTFAGGVWSRSGPVLHERDGLSGTVRPDRIEYVVTMEPHNRKWMFALDIPSDAPSDAVLTDTFTVENLRPVRSRLRYEMVSVPGLALDNGRPGPEWTALPAAGNPQARQLATSWNAKGYARDAIVEQALEMFRKDGFVYTLEPGAAQGDGIDYFLFQSRRGYCEHFSSAMAFLMRAAGIPARVVVGYQGGEVNIMGGYMIVRQSDAHAWTEIWLDGRGWVHIDPTTVVAPQRIERGAEPFVGQARALLPEQGSQFFRSIRRFVQHGWDASNNAWNQWVLDFSFERQQSLWSALGVDEMSAQGAGRLILLVLGAAGTVLGGVFWLLLRPRQGLCDETALLYARFCKKMAALGLHRRSSEGPLDFAGRAVAACPRYADGIEMITAEYVRLRYGTGNSDTGELRQMVRDFLRRKG